MTSELWIMKSFCRRIKKVPGIISWNFSHRTTGACYWTYGKTTKEINGPASSLRKNREAKRRDPVDGIEDPQLFKVYTKQVIYFSIVAFSV